MEDEDWGELVPLLLPRPRDRLRRLWVMGVMAPSPLDFAGLVKASEEARRRRLVVPRAFVDPERAEQTIATLWSFI